MVGRPAAAGGGGGLILGDRQAQGHAGKQLGHLRVSWAGFIDLPNQSMRLCTE
jgi:hypothetical protein